jgi:hypothetical protein
MKIINHYCVFSLDWQNVLTIHRCTPYESFFKFYFIIFTFTYICIHLCIHYLGNTLPPRQNLFCPLVPQFCWRENIKDNKRTVTFFWLVWDGDSCTERFLVLLPCTCVLQPTLVLLYQTSSLLSSLIPIVASASLRLLYSLLYSVHINLIQVLGFLPLPYSSGAQFPLSI